VTERERFTKLYAGFLKAIVVHVVSAPVIGDLNLPVLGKARKIDVFCPLDDFEEALTEVKLVNHKGGSDHVQHTEERWELPVVRLRLFRALDSSEEVLHERDGALDFLVIAWSRIWTLLLDLIRVHHSLNIGRFGVLQEEHAHVVHDGADPLPVQHIPLTDPLKWLEALGIRTEYLVFYPLVVPSCLLAQQLRVDEEAYAPVCEVLVLLGVVGKAQLLKHLLSLHEVLLAVSEADFVLVLDRYLWIQEPHDFCAFSVEETLHYSGCPLACLHLFTLIIIS
jgi:hypothetical protein